MNRRLLLRFATVLLGLMAAGCAPLYAATVIYLCIGQTSTNYQAADYKNCPAGHGSELTSISLGSQLSANPVTTGKAVIKPETVTIIKRVDAVSLRAAKSLLADTSSGSTVIGINEVVASATGEVTRNITLVLVNPSVISVSTQSSSDGPVEVITLTYQSLQIHSNLDAT